MNDTAASQIPNKRVDHAIDESPAILRPEELTMLIQRCVTNDRQSQKKLYYSFYSFAMTICKRYATTQDEAMEVLNDGFLKVFKEIHRYQPAYSDVVSSFRGWLRKIMIYTSIDHFRKNKNHRYHSNIHDGTIQLADINEDALSRISYREIIKSIQKLTPVYRAVLNLFIVEGFTHQEIADELGITVGTSKSNLAKARAQLAKILFKVNELNYDNGKIERAVVSR